MARAWIRGLTGVIMAGIVLLGGIALSSPLGSLQAEFVYYGTVERPDGSFRRMSIDAPSAAQVQTDRPNQPLPEGTTILMETWRSPERASRVFVKTKRQGIWEYGSFPAGQPDLSTRTRSSCHRCHAPFPSVDGTLSLPLLIAFLETDRPPTVTCDRPGRSPCDPETYHPDPA